MGKQDDPTYCGPLQAKLQPVSLRLLAVQCALLGSPVQFEQENDEPLQLLKY
jgi:hypothetical protein